MNALTFNNVKLTPVSQNDNQVWITSKQLSEILGYSRSDSVNKIYERNADEFTQNMARTIEISRERQFDVMGNLLTTVRIFSLRGCHLVAMFSRTKVAKDFRKWVLDVLENLQQTTAKQREVFINACDKLAIGNAKRSDIYTSVAEHFGYDKPVNMPVDILPQAIAYVYEELLAQEKARKADNFDYDMAEIIQDMETIHNYNIKAIKELFHFSCEFAGKYQLKLR